MFELYLCPGVYLLNRGTSNSGYFVRSLDFSLLGDFTVALNNKMFSIFKEKLASKVLQQNMTYV